ncbi:polysaccharide deacetylase family protein [Streptomyces sp. NPDC059568]|uniref:polysaccharide deacetylase family protein n=1 Tax=unclassified Streptomyces TaxID=2593676 RepID=UPI003664EA79
MAKGDGSGRGGSGGDGGGPGGRAKDGSASRSTNGSGNGIAAQATKNQPSRRSRRGRTVAAALLVGAIGSGCAAGAGEVPKPAAAGRPGLPGGPGHGAQEAQKEAPAGMIAGYADNLRRNQAARAIAAKKWGLSATPLPAPRPPTVKPAITTREGFEVQDSEDLPPIFTTVPTKDKVVFLTIDDGSEKDPELLRMMSELKIPYTAFLSDYVISNNYDYFKKMQDNGVTLNNHTLNHPYLPGLSYDEQKREICGQQDKLQQRYGHRPTLFRPPFGNYNRDTLVAAKECGVKAAPLWASEAFPDHMEWREWDKDMHPGDIILTHFRGPDEWAGSMPDMIRQVMKVITDKGYAVGKLEDYV